MIIRKKAVQGTLSEQLNKDKLGLGCRFRDGKVVLDAKTCNEMQISMHVTGASKSLLVLVNTNDLSDFITEEMLYDAQHFQEKLENKLLVFFEQYFVKEVIKQDVLVKN